MPRAKGTVLKPKTASGKKPGSRDTPAMRQYHGFKEQHPGCVLFFRMGDFYEMFDDDAVTVAKALNLTLTERSAGIPMAGVPFHAMESYLRRLVEMGFRVAVCDQIQDPKDAKGVVDRAVTRVVTPGTLVDESLLAEHAGSSLGAVCWADPPSDPRARVTLAAVELATGAFVIDDRPAAEVLDELVRLGVDELMYADTADGEPTPQVARLLGALDIPGAPLPSWYFRADESREQLLEHFGVASLAGFGIDDDDDAIAPAGALLRHLVVTHGARPENLAEGPGANDAARALLRRSLGHIAPPRRSATGHALRLDAVSLRALEVERTVRSGSLDGSLLGLFLQGEACPKTAMGKRTLRSWLIAPPGDIGTISARHAAVAVLVDGGRTRGELRAGLGPVADIARIAGRVSLARATPRDLVAFGRSLASLPTLIDAAEGIAALADHRAALTAARDDLLQLGERIVMSCVENPPGHLREGGLFRDGIDKQLDEARTQRSRSTSWLADYQKQLVEEHDMPSLKVGYNRVFGYYIELPAAQAQRAPAAFTRKQTLKNAERYITPELKSFEERVLTAGERAVERERKLFIDICDAISARRAASMSFAEVAGELDAIAAFAEHAARRGWCRPEMTEAADLDILEGRHPVLERTLDGSFVPNDIALGITHDGTSAARLALITGPNMSGKSTFIRQTALIALLAHAGSFVPAARARIGLTDRIFTRVGADDALHQGQSTFMVEMVETANILNNATDRSLVVLDEIGRGTSTLDGLSLAWAITEHLASITGPADAGTGARTLFATHYHELTDLADRHVERVRNLHVSVKRLTKPGGGEEIVFLHRITPGRASESFGVHVARLAGLPAAVVDRAEALLSSLRVSHESLTGEAGRAAARTPQPSQMSLFTEFLPHPVIEELKATNLDCLSPMDAFDLLRDLQRKAGSAATN